jgi:hypothetical protein
MNTDAGELNGLGSRLEFWILVSGFWILDCPGSDGMV